MTQNQNEPEEVYVIFSQTTYGKDLAKRARYNRFRPEWYSVKYWERLVGPDVNNLRHMRRSISVAAWFVNTENATGRKAFGRREAVLLGVTAALHDQAEAIVGDVPYGRKSAQQRTWEIETLKRHETVFAPRLRGPALRLYRIGRDRIAFGEESDKLAAAFKTIELIGFMHNALDAQRRLVQLRGKLTVRQQRYLGISSSEEQQQLVTALERLDAEVLSSGIIELLIDLGYRFPSAHTFLRRHRNQISDGFDAVPTDIFAWYESGLDPGAGPNEAAVHTYHLSQQHRQWEVWLTSTLEP